MRAAFRPPLLFLCPYHPPIMVAAATLHPSTMRATSSEISLLLGSFSCLSSCCAAMISSGRGRCDDLQQLQQEGAAGGGGDVPNSQWCAATEDFCAPPELSSPRAAHAAAPSGAPPVPVAGAAASTANCRAPQRASARQPAPVSPLLPTSSVVREAFRRPACSIAVTPASPMPLCGMRRLLSPDVAAPGLTPQRAEAIAAAPTGPILFSYKSRHSKEELSRSPQARCFAPSGPISLAMRESSRRAPLGPCAARARPKASAAASPRSQITRLKRRRRDVGPASSRPRASAAPGAEDEGQGPFRVAHYLRDNTQSVHLARGRWFCRPHPAATALMTSGMLR